MSRIIVKNLPKKITEKRVRDLFATKGVITDVQLKFTKNGVFRQFAFVGFESESSAADAVDYYHNTYLDTSRITVESSANLGADDKPRAWSKYSTDSAAHGKRLAANDANADTPDMKRKKLSKKEKRAAVKLNPFEEFKDDPQFEEFLKVQRNVDSGRGKQVWSDDIIIAGKRDHNDDDNDDCDVDNDGESEGREEALSEDQNEHKSSESKPKIMPTKIHEFSAKLKGLPFKVKKRQIKEFLKPVKPISLRIPPKIKGIAFVSFSSLKELNKALVKHRGFMDGHRIEVVKHNIQATNNTTEERTPKWKNAEPAEEPVGESGRLFIRNLSYSCAEQDLNNLFSAYGPLSEVSLPIDSYTKKVKGFAFVTFMFPEHAVKAFTELDGSVFQGRLLHLIPAKAKPEKVELPFAVDDGSSFKRKKEAEKKSSASNSTHQWNTLFLGANAIANVMADRFNVKKSELVADSGASDSVAVRMAIGETQIVSETRRFLMKNGVELDAFSQAATERSKTVILVKNLPANTTTDEVSNLFKKHGLVSRVILPPSGVTAIVEMQESTEARLAFSRLAYNNFKHYPLYLEWAPHNVFKDNTNANEDLDDQTDRNEASVTVEESGEQNDGNDGEEGDESQVEEEPEEGATLFVKNLNFDTNEPDFRRHFEKCGQLVSATIAYKKGDNGQLSMGYGFVQFRQSKGAQKALKELQRSLLDGHALELKTSHRASVAQKRNESLRKVAKARRQTGTKIVVRNIPFEASSKEVEQLFRVFGELKTVRLPKKMVGTGTHRGFGFIDFVTKNDAKRAFNALCHSTHLYGRRLVLEWANDDSANDDEFDAVSKSLAAKGSL